MGVILTNPGGAGGGGGISDELTGYAKHALKGFTFVTRDSDDEPIEGQIESSGAQGNVRLHTGKTSVSYDVGYYGYAHGADIELQEKTVAASTQKAVVVTPDANKVLSKVTVDQILTQEKTVDASPDKAVVVDPDTGKLLSKVTVNKVKRGSQGTPAITKTVSATKHIAYFDASCTDTTGWIDGATKNAEQKNVTASELVSGERSETEPGSYDVTNYATFKMNISYYEGSVT